MINTLRKRRGDEGFTLIELLIVIVILGILAAVVVISVSGITDRGGKSACQASRTSVLTAGEAFYAQNGTYPANAAALVPTFLNPAGATVAVNTVSSTSGGWSLTYTPGAVGTPQAITACP